MDAIDLPCEKIERRRFQSINNEVFCRFSVPITFEKRDIVFFVGYFHPALFDIDCKGLMSITGYDKPPIALRINITVIETD